MREFNLNPEKNTIKSSESSLKKLIEFLKSNYVPLGKPKSGEWRFSFSELVILLLIIIIFP